MFGSARRTCATIYRWRRFSDLSMATGALLRARSPRRRLAPPLCGDAWRPRGARAATSPDDPARRRRVRRRPRPPWRGLARAEQCGRGGRSGTFEQTGRDFPNRKQQRNEHISYAVVRGRMGAGSSTAAAAAYARCKDDVDANLARLLDPDPTTPDDPVWCAANPARARVHPTDSSDDRAMMTSSSRVVLPRTMNPPR